MRRFCAGLLLVPGAAAYAAPSSQDAAASGAGFDTLFISTQMDAHMAAMAAGQKELSDGSDAQVKKAAQSAAPVTAAHHDALNAAARALGVRPASAPAPAAKPRTGCSPVRSPACWASVSC
ncbi:DUF4142 domain-containing protein [Actinoplanes sp. CA-030573]|uniref:DUF4142 domain-containing protein n=1 Tax=Actinoplanes sp. CA-030573 TaxID=3239898 RepID=UPI003D8E0ED8